MDVGSGYRLLEEGEKVQEGDDCTTNGKWTPSVAWVPGNLCNGEQVPDHMPYRRKIPDPSAPVKSFTPNKYTRYIPTLDGRKVPVDVYCVLAAFPTGSSAVDHAVKKLLAPGQRGHKDRIQDLKEARDSLTRAIELEEAVGPDA